MTEYSDCLYQLRHWIANLPVHCQLTLPHYIVHTGLRYITITVPKRVADVESLIKYVFGNILDIIDLIYIKVVTCKLSIVTRGDNW